MVGSDDLASFWNGRFGETCEFWEGKTLYTRSASIDFINQKSVCHSGILMTRPLSLHQKTHIWSWFIFGKAQGLTQFVFNMKYMLLKVTGRQKSHKPKKKQKVLRYFRLKRMAWETPSKNELQIGVVCEDGNPTVMICHDVFVASLYPVPGSSFWAGKCVNIYETKCFCVFFPQSLMAGFPENSGLFPKFGEVHLLGLQGLRDYQVPCWTSGWPPQWYHQWSPLHYGRSNLVV